MAGQDRSAEKTTSSTALFQMHELLKTIGAALSSYTSTFRAISALDHPLLIAIP